MKKQAFHKLDFNVQSWLIGIAFFFLLSCFAAGLYALALFVLMWWIIGLWQLISGFINVLGFRSKLHLAYLLVSFAYLAVLVSIWLYSSEENAIIAWVLASWLIAFVYLGMTYKFSKYDEQIPEKEFDIADHLIIDV